MYVGLKGQGLWLGQLGRVWDEGVCLIYGQLCEGDGS